MARTDVRPGGAEHEAPLDGVEKPASAAVEEQRGTLSRSRHLLARALQRYPELPPAPQGRWPRVALGIVALLALAYVAFFCVYLFTQQDAYLTHAEDLGIMDQALWNTVHGAVLHQTICNTVTDTNCLGDISRLAIHFEPLMLPISLLYLIAPSPKTLQALQALVVASGAFPAYWIALRRLRSPFAGIVFAAVYLLYPALQGAVTYDFHAVTLSAAFLMFALYFMLVRNDKGLLIACVLALSTKEQIPLDVAMIGLSVALLQRRWRLGFGLVALSVAWLGVALLAMHLASPFGYSPTASRYSYLGHSPIQAAFYVLTHPLQVLRQHILDSGGILYLRKLLSPVAYLPLLSPLTLLIAAPALAINLLSDKPEMYSGIYQYNADIVPILVLAAIESVALLAAIAGALSGRVVPAFHRAVDSRVRLLPSWHDRHNPLRRVSVSFSRVAPVALTLVVLFFSLYQQRERGYLPVAKGFTWPQVTAHARLADSIIAHIPPNATVSAQSDLVPHLSHRRFIYMYPYHAESSDYVFLDVTGNTYPLNEHLQTYTLSVQHLLQSHALHVVDAEDGYLLLAHGPGPALDPAGPFGLPPAFYSFTRATPAAISHPLQARFGASLNLLGYDISPSPTSYENTWLTITTYWRVSSPLSGAYFPQIVLTRQDGSEGIIADFAATAWLPLNQWQPGQLMRVQTQPIYITHHELGRLRIGVRIMPAPSPTQTPVPLTVTLLSPPGAGGSAPTLLDHRSVAVLLDAQVLP